MNYFRIVTFITITSWLCLNAVTTTELKHEYMLANYYTSLGKYDKAQEWFQKVITDNPPPYVYEGYIDFLYKTKNYGLIVALIPKLDSLFANNPEVQRIFATSLENMGNKKEAFDRFIQMSSKFPTDQETIFRTAQIFILQGNFEKALATLQQYLDKAPRKPNNFIFYFIKAQIHLQLKQIKEAQESIKQSVELYPHFDKSWLLYALIEEQVGNISNAINGYTSFLEQSQEAANAQIEQHLLELVLKQKIESNKKNINVNSACFEKIKSFFQKKKYRKGVKQFDQCIQEPSSAVKKQDDATQAKLMEIVKKVSLGKLSHATRLLQTCMQEEPYNDVWFYTLQLLCHHHVSYKKAIRILQHVEKRQPEALLPLLYQADLYLRVNNPIMAIHYLQKSLEHTTDTTLQSKILSQQKLCTCSDLQSTSIAAISTNSNDCSMINNLYIDSNAVLKTVSKIKKPLFVQRSMQGLRKIIMGYR